MFRYNKILLFVVALPALLQASSTEQSDRIPNFVILDQGEVVVSGPAANTIITYSDVYEKLSLDGKLISLEQQIKTEIIRQEVVSSQMAFDTTAPEKYLSNIQKTNNLTIEDLEELAAQCGRTYTELKDQLGLNYIKDFFYHNKFRSHLVPTDQEVLEYYTEHPEIEPGYCVIKVSQVKFSDDKQAVQARVKAIAVSKADDSSISWSEPIKVAIDDLADDMQFIQALVPGETFVIEGKNVFELYHLVEKKDEIVIPLQDRKAFIIDILNRHMYEDLLAEYEKHMFDSVAIVNLTASAI